MKIWETVLGAEEVGESWTAGIECIYNLLQVKAIAGMVLRSAGTELTHSRTPTIRIPRKKIKGWKRATETQKLLSGEAAHVVRATTDVRGTPRHYPSSLIHYFPGLFRAFFTRKKNPGPTPSTVNRLDLRRGGGQENRKKMDLTNLYAPIFVFPISSDVKSV